MDILTYAVEDMEETCTARVLENDTEIIGVPVLGSSLVIYDDGKLYYL